MSAVRPSLDVIAEAWARDPGSARLDLMDCEELERVAEVAERALAALSLTAIERDALAVLAGARLQASTRRTPSVDEVLHAIDSTARAVLEEVDKRR